MNRCHRKELGNEMNSILSLHVSSRLLLFLQILNTLVSSLTHDFHIKFNLLVS